MDLNLDINKMIKLKDVTFLNVDDYVRERLRNGAKKIFWDKNGANLLKLFLINSGFQISSSFPKGDIFMGIKHYKKKYKSFIGKK